MAKKKPAPKPAAKTAAKTTAAPRGRQKTVSVKRIVAEIDRTLAKLEPVKAVAAKRTSAPGGDPQAYAIDRAILSLRGARDVMKGVCVPGFDIPI